MPKTLEKVSRGGGYLRDGEKSRSNQKRWRDKQTPEWRFNRSLVYKFGITIEHYYSMLDSQAGRCAICRTMTPGRYKNFFCVDHDHATGEIRGLLCDSCNIGLSKFRDDTNVVLRAALYLARSR